MDELIAEIAANTGVEPAIARNALAIIIGFLAREGPTGHAQTLIDGLPGARELASEAAGGSAGIMGVFNDLTRAGLGLGAIQGVTREFVAYARGEVGDQAVDEVISGIPGLSQFV